MRSLIALSSFAFAAAVPAEPIDIPGMQGIGDTRYHQIESGSAGRSYQVLVGLPADYSESPDTRYPTVYVLDGGELYPLLAAYQRYLFSAGEVPESIIVGISYGTGDWKVGNDRSHDYTAPAAEREHWGGAPEFQSFLRDELLPMIESRYRSRTDRRIIFGQSIGGQFVLYTAQTRPGLFWGHIASNPALHRNLAFFLAPHWQDHDDDIRSRLFVSSGSHDDSRFRTPALAWMRHWTSADDTPWDLEATTLDGHSHFSAPPAAYRQGMTWLFD